MLKELFEQTQEMLLPVTVSKDKPIANARYLENEILDYFQENRVVMTKNLRPFVGKLTRRLLRSLAASHKARYVRDSRAVGRVGVRADSSPRDPKPRVQASTAVLPARRLQPACPQHRDAAGALFALPPRQVLPRNLVQRKYSFCPCGARTDR